MKQILYFNLKSRKFEVMACYSEKSGIDLRLELEKQHPDKKIITIK